MSQSRKIVMMLVALLGAILLWLYVVTFVTPEYSKSISSVPISMDGLEVLDHLEKEGTDSALHGGHLDVAEDDIIMLFGGHFQADGAVFGRFYLVPLVGEDFLERIAYRPFVVDNQDLHNTDLKVRHLPPKNKISAFFPIFIPD